MEIVNWTRQVAIPLLTLTRHAEDMLIERGIERAWVEATISHPDTVESDPMRPGVVRAFRKIAERDSRSLRVVYIQNSDKIRVLTAFFDRGRR